MVLLCVHRCWFFRYYHFFVSLLPCLVLEHITSFGNTSYWHELGTFTLLRAIRYIGNKEDCKLDFREFPFPAPSQIGFWHDFTQWKKCQNVIDWVSLLWVLTCNNSENMCMSLIAEYSLQMDNCVMIGWLPMRIRRYSLPLAIWLQITFL